MSKNSPATLAVREGVQLAVYSLIFEGVKKNNLWDFRDSAAGAAFMRELDAHQKAIAAPCRRRRTRQPAGRD